MRALKENALLLSAKQRPQRRVDSCAPSENVRTHISPQEDAGRRLDSTLAGAMHLMEKQGKILNPQESPTPGGVRWKILWFGPFKPMGLFNTEVIVQQCGWECSNITGLVVYLLEYSSSTCVAFEPKRDNPFSLRLGVSRSSPVRELRWWVVPPSR
jgi:hypothetical protein